MGSVNLARYVGLALLCLVIISFYPFSAFGQGIRQSPYGAPTFPGGGADPFAMGASNPLAEPMGGLVGPRENDSILLSPGMFRGILPNIPNIKAGYLYSFGDIVESGRLSVDLVQPVLLGGSSAVFGEFHNEWQDFWKTVTRGANHRVDLSLGGGYRTIFNGNTLVGVNAFYDTTRLGGTWFESGGVGGEFAALLPGNDVIDLQFNWYGNLFNSNVLANAFRRGPQNYDFQAGYSQQLWDDGPDVRLSATGYRFSAGAGVYGYRAGAELKTPDGMFSVKYEAAHDRVNETYHTVGGFVKLGLQLENLLSGASPFTLPEPIFSSPRNFARRLKEPVDREWRQPGSIVVAKASGSSGSNGGDVCDDGPRYIKKVKMVRIARTFYEPNPRPKFPRVDYRCLNRGQSIRVTFNYKFEPEINPNFSYRIRFFVQAWNSSFYNSVVPPVIVNSTSGVFDEILDWPSSRQNRFINNKKYPSRIAVTAGHISSDFNPTDLEFTDVIIRFNQ